MSRFRVGSPRLLTWTAVTGLAIVIFGAAIDGDVTAAGTPHTNTASSSTDQVRLTGVVVPGTVQVDNTSTSFALEHGGKQILVISANALPVTVTDNQQVVIEAQMRPDGVWVADQVSEQSRTLNRFSSGR